MQSKKHLHLCRETYAVQASDGFRSPTLSKAHFFKKIIGGKWYSMAKTSPSV